MLTTNDNYIPDELKEARQDADRKMYKEVVRRYFLEFGNGKENQRKQHKIKEVIEDEYNVCIDKASIKQAIQDIRLDENNPICEIVSNNKGYYLGNSFEDFMCAAHYFAMKVSSGLRMWQMVVDRINANLKDEYQLPIDVFDFLDYYDEIQKEEE